MADQLLDLVVPFFLACHVVAAAVELSRRLAFLAWQVKGEGSRPAWWRQLWRVLSIVYGFAAGAVASVLQGADLWQHMAIGAGAGLLSTVVVAAVKQKIKAQGGKP